MEFYIKNKVVGNGHPVFFIAEAGVNHNGSIKLAKQLVDSAVEAGADAVKFQSFITENIITPDAPKSSYHKETTGDDNKQSWFELLKTQEMSEAMHIDLMDYCEAKNIIFLSTPYDEESADLLDKLGVPAFKVASTDTNNIPFLQYLARKGKPIILSSAMCSMTEVFQAVSCVNEVGLKEVAMLQCTGSYPTEPQNSNLRIIQTYQQELKCVVGFSDHTTELTNAIAATAVGAKIYEKHFTLDKSLPGPDHRMSIDPEELIKTVEAVRKTEKALGSCNKQVLDIEEENRLKLRKSLVSKHLIMKGQMINKEMLAIKRPGSGIPPSEIDSIIGKVALEDIQTGELLSYDLFKDE